MYISLNFIAFNLHKFKLPVDVFPNGSSVHYSIRCVLYIYLEFTQQICM